MLASASSIAIKHMHQSDQGAMFVLLVMENWELVAFQTAWRKIQWWVVMA